MKSAELLRRDVLKMAAAAGVGAAFPKLLRAADQPPAPPRMNVVLILADDLGYECIGANGGTSYKTPHLDQMAAGGMRFEHCYAQPLCTPTRVQLLTGAYNVRNYTRFGHMDPGLTTFANLFRDAGYATCMAGKWQLGRDADLPRRFGFDRYCLWQHLRRPSRYANPGLEVMGKPVNYTQGEYGPDLLSAYALDFVTQNRDRPFLLYYPLTLPHDPFQPTPDSPDWDPKAKGETPNQKPKHFADMVAYMDKLVGKLLAKLDELKLRERTLVIFVSDNGTGQAIESKLGQRVVRGGKGDTSDAGTRVPLIVNCPGVVRAGQVSSDLVDTTDLLPTLCEAAGIKVPPGLKVDGQSFYPQLVGQRGTPRRWVYCWYARDGGAQATAEFARTQRYKLYTDGRFYDVGQDPTEASPLDAARLDRPGAEARALLADALAGFKDARPASVAAQGGKGGGTAE